MAERQREYRRADSGISQAGQAQQHGVFSESNGGVDMKTAYSFVVLRYVHDVVTGEFINIGVALYAPGAKYLGGLCNTRSGRVSRMFGEVDGDYFRGLMRYIETRFKELGDNLRNELPLHGVPADILQIAKGILPPDDSSLQWSEAGGGQTENPAKTLEDMFARMVERYEGRTQR